MSHPRGGAGGGHAPVVHAQEAALTGPRPDGGLQLLLLLVALRVELLSDWTESRRASEDMHGATESENSAGDAGDGTLTQSGEKDRWDTAGLIQRNGQTETQK